jgi:type I restriction-modification system DNA methylase subunit
MADKKLTSEIESVLRAARIEGNKLYLTGQLDPRTYKEVKTFLANLGATWNRKEQVHVFSSDPAKLIFALEEGVAVDEKKKFQSFFTPEAVAKRVVEIADVENCIVLEPSAGHGALADEIMKKNPDSLRCCELNPEFIEVLFSKGYMIRVGDFLQQDLEVVYDRVVMNPPFSKNQWVGHIQHAYKFLKPGGKLVAITPDSLSNKKFQDFVVDKRWEYEKVEAGSFKESGTLIETNIVTIWKY